MAFPPASDAHLRCSDAEREQVATFLRDHAAEGRLTADELSDRVALAYRAVTIGELQWLVEDLPGGSRRRAPARRRPAVVAVAGMALLAALVPGALALVVLAIALSIVVTVLALGLALAPFVLVAAATVYALQRMSTRRQLRWPRG